jgi:hypothetical protein
MVRRELAEQIELLIDEIYHGHTFATAINTMKQDVREGRFKVTLHDIDYPSGPPKRGKRFASISVRDDVIEWFKDEMKKHGEEYQVKYGKAAGTRLGPFAVRLLMNMLLSKKEQSDLVLRLKPDDYGWLREQFEKSKDKYGVDTFEQFLPLFVRDCVRKARTAS